MKVLLLDPAGKGIYYQQFRIALKEACDVFQYGPGLPHYNPQHDIFKVLKIYEEQTGNLKPDLILTGFGWEDDKHPTNFNIHQADLRLNETDIKKAFIINKEYKKLKQKFDFVKASKFDVGFTVLHNTEHFTAQTGTPFYRLPFAANDNIFKDYGESKVIDLGFSGNMFNSSTYKNTGLMGPLFNNIRERIYEELQEPEYSSCNIWWNSNAGKFLHGEKYARLINSSKIWLNTPSAVEIINPRYYEIIGCNTLLFCRKADRPYKDLGFLDGQTCVTFEQDLSNFKEKLFHYINNEEDRNEITQQAMLLFKERHSWRHRVNFLMETCLTQKK